MCLRVCKNMPKIWPMAEINLGTIRRYDCNVTILLESAPSARFTDTKSSRLGQIQEKGINSKLQLEKWINSFKKEEELSHCDIFVRMTKKDGSSIQQFVFTKKPIRTKQTAQYLVGKFREVSVGELLICKSTKFGY